MVIFLEGYILLTIGLSVILLSIILLLSKLFFKDLNNTAHNKNRIYSIFVFLIGVIILLFWSYYKI